jgi:hypothetical protein
MKTHWLDDRLTYDGTQLAAHWILARTGLCGDALVAFRGPCRVPREQIADLADVDGPGIAGDDMVHCIWECFTAPDLLLAVHRQRLLAATAAELLRELAPGAAVARRGDDLFVGEGKLSISVAAPSGVSSLIHFAVNATPGGAPLQVATLRELGVEPRAFAARLLQAVADEQRTIDEARGKVTLRGEWPR